MTVHLARGVPWLRLLVTSALLLGLLVTLREDPLTLWPLQGTAVGLLAAAVGWCFDDASAEVVDPLPRDLHWQASVRLLPVLLLLVAWSVGCWWVRDALLAHPWAIWGQGLAAAAVACAWVLWRRIRGEAEPGHLWALAVVPIVTGWALLHPARATLPVFPYAGEDATAWSLSVCGWAVLGCLGLVAWLVLRADLGWHVRAGAQ